MTSSSLDGLPIEILSTNIIVFLDVVDRLQLGACCRSLAAAVAAADLHLRPEDEGDCISLDRSVSHVTYLLCACESSKQCVVKTSRDVEKFEQARWFGSRSVESVELESLCSGPSIYIYFRVDLER